MVREGGESGSSIVPVGQWLLLVLIRPGDAPNRWRIVDPFDPDVPQSHRVNVGTDGDVVTSYDIIGHEKLPKLLNLRIDSVTRAYDAIAELGGVKSRANHFVLELILAADTCTLRKAEFLRGAKKLNEWVIAKDGEAPVHLVNRWQIEWRNGSLTAQDRDAVRELKREVLRTRQHLANEIELACALLLGDTEEAAYLTGQMSPEQLEQMEAWPIWRLRDQTGG